MLGNFFIYSWKSNSSLGTPLWIPHMFIWLGILFLGLEIVASIVKKFRDFQKGSKVDVHEKELETIGY